MRILPVVILALFTVVFQSSTAAQNLRLQQVTHAGVVKNISGNIIQFESDQGMVRAECLLPTGNRQQLALSEFGSTRINVRGHDSIKFLKKGMTIRFEAEVFRGAKILNPVKQVTLITRHNFTQLGMQPLGDGLPDRRDEDAEKEQEENGDENDVKNAGSNRDRTQKMVVTGVLNFIDDEKFKIEIPDARRGRNARRITVKWDEEPVARIDAQELTYIQPDDRITVVGYVIRGLNVMATSVEVEHVNPDVAVPDDKAEALPNGQIFPQNNPLEKGFDGNNADLKENKAEVNKGDTAKGDTKNSGGRKPKKNRSPGRVFKIN